MAYAVGLIMAHGASDRCAGGINADLFLCEKFGSLWKSCFTTIQAMFGGLPWGTLADVLADADRRYASFFVAFLIFVVVAWLNISCGICVHYVKLVAEQERDIFHLDQLKNKERLMRRMAGVFRKLDINASGGISRNEFEFAFKGKEIVALLGSLSLDDQSPDSLFDALDRDRSGQMTLSEFVLGCLKLSAPARNLDVERICTLMSSVGKNYENYDGNHRQVAGRPLSGQGHHCSVPVKA